LTKRGLAIRIKKLARNEHTKSTLKTLNSVEKTKVKRKISSYLSKDEKYNQSQDW